MSLVPVHKRAMCVYMCVLEVKLCWHVAEDNYCYFLHLIEVMVLFGQTHEGSTFETIVFYYIEKREKIKFII